METLTAYVREHAPSWQTLTNSFVQLQISSSGGETKTKGSTPEEPNNLVEQMGAQIRSIATPLGMPFNLPPDV